MSKTAIALALSACLSLAGVSDAFAIDVQSLQSKADHGDDVAMVELGRYYLEHNDSARGLIYLEHVIRQGSGQAAYAHAAIGRHYEKMGQSPVFRDSMMYHYRRAAILGDVGSQVQLGAVLLKDAQKDAEPAMREFVGTQAKTLLEHAATKGKSYEAAYQLGHAYVAGLGLPMDLTRGKQWLKTAADGKHGLAAYELGSTSLANNDPATAQRYLEMAADQGNGQAMVALAEAYTSGRGLPSDLGKAKQWASKAVAAKAAGASTALANVQKESERASAASRAAYAVPAPARARPTYAASAAAAPIESRREAPEVAEMRRQAALLRQQLAALQERITEVAATRGSAASAQPATYAASNARQEQYQAPVESFPEPPVEDKLSVNQMGLDAHARGDFEQAYKYFSRAARKGDSDAMNNMGMLLLQGQGVASDTGKAIELFRQAAGMGHVTAAHNIGYIYENGIGVRQDLARSRVWYQYSSSLSQKQQRTRVAGL